MSGTLGTAATNPRAASGSGWTPRLVLSLVSIALVLEIVSLSSTMAAVAMMPIGEHFETDQVAWVTTAYLLAAAVACPLAGKLADIHGKRKVFLIAMAIAAVGALMSAVAPASGPRDRPWPVRRAHRLHVPGLLADARRLSAQDPCARGEHRGRRHGTDDDSVAVHHRPARRCVGIPLAVLVPADRPRGARPAGHADHPESPVRNNARWTTSVARCSAVASPRSWPASASAVVGLDRRRHPADAPRASRSSRSGCRSHCVPPTRSWICASSVTARCCASASPQDSRTAPSPCTRHSSRSCA